MKSPRADNPPTARESAAQRGARRCGQVVQALVVGALLAYAVLQLVGARVAETSFRYEGF